MKTCKYLILLLTLMTILCSCADPEKQADIYEQIYKKYNQVNSYQCQVKMVVAGNKTTKEYVMNQYYKSPDRYKMVILEPEEIKGLTTVYVHNEVTTFQPEIQGKFTLLNYTPIDKSYIFLPDFFKTFYQSEQASVTATSQQKNRYTVLKADIPGNNIYRYSQGIWIENDTLLPYKIEVYDIKQRPVIRVIFEEVQINPVLEDNIFEVQN